MNNNKRNKLLSGFALASIVIVMIVIFWGVRTENPIVFLFGIGLFFLTVLTGIFIGNGGVKPNGSGKTTDGSKKNALKYEPLLLDERTKQDPDVQRLLQYVSVQKVFFDPEYLKTVAAQNDPHVIELLGVFDNILSSRTVNGDYPGKSVTNGTNAYTREHIQNEIKRREDGKNKPRRIAGAVLGFTGLALLIIPFLTVFIASMNGSEAAGKTASFLFSAAPVGMALIVAGSIVWKR